MLSDYRTNRQTLFVRALCARADIFTLTGNSNKAKQDLRLGLSIAKEIDNRRLEAQCLLMLCELYASLSKIKEVIKNAKKSLVLCGEIRDKSIESSCFNNIGYCYYYTGDYRKAFKYFSKSLLIKRKNNLVEQQAENLLNVGAACFYLGQYKKELQYYKKCLQLSERMKDLRMVGTALNSIASHYKSIGKFNKNMEFLMKALKIREQISDRRGQAITLNNIAAGYINSGDYEKAFDFASRALVIQKELGYIQEESFTLYNLGLLHYFTGRNKAAKLYVQRSLEISQQLGDKAGSACCYNILGKICVEQSAIREAKKLLETGKAIANKIKDKRIGYKLTLSCAELELLRGNSKSAYSLAKKILHHANKLQLHSEKGEAHLLMARILWQKLATRGRKPQLQIKKLMSRVKSEFNEAIMIFEKINHLYDLAKAHSYFSHFLRQTGNRLADKYLTRAEKLGAGSQHYKELPA